jgi:hypothetical protein
MSQDIPAEITSILQSTHINRHPSPHHDINPSTAASQKRPVRFSSHPDLDDDSDVGEDEIPLSALDPVPRRQNMPPLPDMRFEQSYLKSIEKAEGWQGVLWITMRDQVIMCFAQGVLWTLILSGWRHFNRSAKFSGHSVGAKIRRWWWGVNKWQMPGQKGSRLADGKLAEGVKEVSVTFMKVRKPSSRLQERADADSACSITRTSSRAQESTSVLNTTCLYFYPVGVDGATEALYMMCVMHVQRLLESGKASVCADHIFTLFVETNILYHPRIPCICMPIRFLINVV